MVKSALGIGFLPIRRGVLLAGTIVATLLLWAASAAASTFRVTRFDDPSPGPCVTGDCSLREAVDAADNAHGTNTILVPAGVYSLKIANLSLNVLSTNVTLQGVGGQATIDGNGPFVTGTRVLYVFSGGHATLNKISVRDGFGPKDADNIDRGGGIRVDNGGSLNMTNGDVYDNTDADTAAQGAGIYNNGQMQLNLVTVENNFMQSAAFAGGIYTDAHGQTTVTNSVIENNFAAFGGGFSGTGFLTVSRSLIRENSASDGGGAYLNGCAGPHFAYDTFTGNIAGDVGGAIRDANASVSLEHVTMSGNQALTAGGGIAVNNFTGGCPTDFFLHDTILAGNTAPTSPDCIDQTTGDIRSQGHNIVGDATGCGASPQTGDQFGTGVSPVDPRLGHLENNGGPTFTMALLPGSAAIGAADPTTCGPTDQRGFVIARDGDGHGCDIGAYEVFLPPKLKAAPTVSGKHNLGSQLTCSSGKWGGATPLAFSFRWLRNGHAINGAKTSHRKIAAADLGQKLSCAVTATNVAGTATANSAGVKIPRPAAHTRRASRAQPAIQT